MPSLSKRLMGGWTELHVAAEAGDLARVRQAVQKNPSDLDKTTRQDKQTALHLAATNGFEAVVGELLDRQARTTIQDEAGRTPLHAAAVAGRSRCVAVLLGFRNRDPPAEKSRLMALRDRDGRDALMAAVVSGHSAVVEELVRGGADAGRCVDQAGRGLVLAAVQYGHVHLLPLLAPACGTEQRDPASGATPLHLAAETGNLQAIEWLQRAGANPATRDNSGRTPLEVARAAGQTVASRVLRDGPAGSSGGGSSIGAVGGSEMPRSGGSASTGHDLYSPPSAPALGAVLPQGYGYGATSSTPWQQPGAAQQAGPEAVAPGGRVLQVPVEPPAPVFYPTPPAGAGVYF